MANQESVRFDRGWDAAVAEVKEKVEQYIEAKQEGQPLDPWEEWLPRFLELLAVASADYVRCDRPKPEVPVGWNPLMPFTTDASVWANKFNELALVPRRDLVGLPQTCPSVQCPIVRRPDIRTLSSWFTSAIEAGRATGLRAPK
jgi:hypothetical protein